MIQPQPYIHKERESVFITSKPPIVFDEFDGEVLRPLHCEQCGNLFYKTDYEIARDTGYHIDLCYECKCEAEFFIM